MKMVLKNNGNILKFDRAVFIYAYMFLLFPVLIFFCFWTKLYIGVPVSALAALGLYAVIKSKRQYRDIFGKDYKKNFLIMALTAFVWTLLSGQGGVLFQNADFNMRNAIFSDLVRYEWPVIFKIPQNIAEGLQQGTSLYENALFYAGKEVSIVYYLGFWLPSALLGKAVMLVFGEGAGLAVANVLLFLWTFSGVFTVLYLFSRAFKNFSYKIIAVFIFFSGMDAIFSSFYYIIGLQGLILPEGRIIPHLDAWTMQQFTSNTSALFWVFNQAVPLWLFCCILLNEEDIKHIFLPFSCLALNSTLPLVGALPLIIFFIFKKYADRLKTQNNGVRPCFKGIINELLRYINISNISAVPVIAVSYLYLISSPNSEAFSFMGGSPNLLKLLVIAGSLLFEIGILAAILFAANDKENKKLLIFLTALLCVIPFFNMGTRFDFTMRASLPALFFLCYIACGTLLKSSKKQICRLLAAVLIIGGLTAGAEMLQPVVYIFTGQDPRADNIESLSDITSTKFDPKNCLGTMDSLFMKYIIRRNV